MAFLLSGCCCFTGRGSVRRLHRRRNSAAASSPLQSTMSSVFRTWARGPPSHRTSSRSSRVKTSLSSSCSSREPMCSSSWSTSTTLHCLSTLKLGSVWPPSHNPAAITDALLRAGAAAVPFRKSRPTAASSTPTVYRSPKHRNCGSDVLWSCCMPK